MIAGIIVIAVVVILLLACVGGYNMKQSSFPIYPFFQGLFRPQ